MKEISDMDNFTKSMNEIKTMRQTSFQSPTVTQRKNDEKNPILDSQSDYFNDMNKTAFRSNARMNQGDMSQNSFFNSMSSSKKKFHSRQKTLWDGVMHQKYLTELQKDIENTSIRKAKLNDMSSQIRLYISLITNRDQHLKA